VYRCDMLMHVSYTIQGGREETTEDRGVLPRAIDVVFNSIAGMESKVNVSAGFFGRQSLT
jgi:hypothetical protein